MLNLDKERQEDTEQLLQMSIILTLENLDNDGQ
jgi:hypothetical protein